MFPLFAVGYFPFFFPMFGITHDPNPSLSLESKSFFSPDGFLQKSPALNNAVAGFLLGVMPQLHNGFQRLCRRHCKLGQSSVCHNHHHHHNNKTSTASLWPTDLHHCHDNNVCMSVPQCVSLFFPGCEIVAMAIPHCTLTFFLFSIKSVHSHHCCALLWLHTTKTV